MALLRLDRFTTGAAGTVELPARQATRAVAVKEAVPGSSKYNRRRPVTRRGSVCGAGTPSLAQAAVAVCRDGERVSNRRFSQATGWHPEH